jgi:hypothetical protein
MNEKDTAGNDLLEQLRQYGIEKAKQPQSACPSCGHCPHCGRGGYGTLPMYPGNPPQYPRWPNWGQGGALWMVDLHSANFC